MTDNMGYRSVDDSSLVPGFKWIVVDKNYMGGRPAIRGFRISVQMLADDVKNGWTEKDFEREYDLPLDAVREALRYEREMMGGDPGLVAR